jgi:hypothetical protein
MNLLIKKILFYFAILNLFKIININKDDEHEMDFFEKITNCLIIQKTPDSYLVIDHIAKHNYVPIYIDTLFHKICECDNFHVYEIFDKYIHFNHHHHIHTINNNHLNYNHHIHILKNDHSNHNHHILIII